MPEAFIDGQWVASREIAVEIIIQWRIEVEKQKANLWQINKLKETSASIGILFLFRRVNLYTAIHCSE